MQKGNEPEAEDNDLRPSPRADEPGGTFHICRRSSDACRNVLQSPCL